MFSSELPDVQLVSHIIENGRDDFDTILSALQHLIEMQQAGLPKTSIRRSVSKEANWQAKLIFAELKQWAQESASDHLHEFSGMLKSLIF